ncbi:MAG: glycosyltransferase [Deltaproteobacteria bacterium]|nr:glycosyltransferase [Deltaproteobacteria bacterium]
MNRQIYFLLPGTGARYAGGGLWAELKTLAVAQQDHKAHVITYEERQDGVLFLDDVLKSEAPEFQNGIYIMSWGWHIAELSKRLQHKNLVYHAHSAGYDFTIPETIPILCVSRQTMGYWGQKAPHAPVFYLPNLLSHDFCDANNERDIDVLFLKRKASTYLSDIIVPVLQKIYKVHVVESFAENLIDLYQRSKIYLYDSTDHWSEKGVSEGFGLHPIEAMACGCQVFSSVNGGLADYLDPGFNCFKMGQGTVEFDLQNITSALAGNKKYNCDPKLFEEYRYPNVKRRWDAIIEELEGYFNFLLSQQAGHL